MKTSFITTVFNEEKTIRKFLDSILFQTYLPDEIIIVDGGSTDNTLLTISNFKFPISNIKIKIIQKKGNRSVGRNEAITHATGDIILCSDSGNILDKNWIKNITKPFVDKSVDVVAGYYKGKAKNIFQKCLIPYALVMLDKVNEDNFLPATRSMAFKKTIWKKVRGFPQEYSHNEDYVFANRLKHIRAKIVFEKTAIVYWIPRSTYKQAYTMFWRFAFGDAEARIIRTTVLLLFARYTLAFYLLFLCVLYRSFIGLSILAVCFIFYLIWSIKKNYRYVIKSEAYVILPRLQLTADAAVLSGTSLGLLRLINPSALLQYIKKNKFLFFVLIFYILIILSGLKWGIPNQYHPFPYQMDEWHQFHAVGTTFTKGTPNTVGSANGTMFHFIETGFYIAPFIAVNFIDPFHLGIDNSFMRGRVFEILRINTLFYGVLSIIVLYNLARQSKASEKLTILLFTLTPIWLSLSGYFKYDIALIFWILLSLLFFQRFVYNPSNRSFILAAIPAGLAVSVKVSALPLFIVYIFSYFWFSRERIKNLKYFFVGVGVFAGVIILFGIPDSLFGRGNVVHYMYENLITLNLNTLKPELGMSETKYLYVKGYKILFGNGLYFGFILSFIFLLFTYFKSGLRKSFSKNKWELFLIFVFFMFLISLRTLGIGGGSNRALVLLPFLALIIGLVYKKIDNILNNKMWVFGLVAIIIIIQLFESFAWNYMKLVKNPQEVSSVWIQKNIPMHQTIGVENIPIYQKLPDIIEKEFYYNQYGVSQKKLYNYIIVDSKTKKLPSIIIITDGEFEAKVYKNTTKNELVKRIEKEGYKEIAVFYPDFRYYKYLGNDIDYFLAGIGVSPTSTTIYKK